MERTMKLLAIVILAMGLLPATVQAQSASRHEGYYYPKLTSTETYVSRARTLGDSNRSRRLGFVTALTTELTNFPYPPQYAIFAKGDEAEKLIIVGNVDGALSSIYRARALFATMTSHARLSKLFQDFAVEEIFTFFDLAKMMGFTEINVTDGAKFAHRVNIK